MKITKTQKGITLIALIITIVVLIILAAVAINSITSTNLIDRTSAAGQKWKEGQANEAGILSSYESFLSQTDCKHEAGWHTDVNVEAARVVECEQGNHGKLKYICNSCGYVSNEMSEETVRFGTTWMDTVYNHISRDENYHYMVTKCHYCKIVFSSVKHAHQFYYMNGRYEVETEDCQLCGYDGWYIS